MTAALVEKASPRLAYRQLHRIADRLEPELRRAFLLAVERLRRTVSLETITQAVIRGDVGALRQLGLWDEVGDALRPALRETAERAILGGLTVGGEILPASIGAQLSLSLTNPRAVEAINTVVADALRDIVNASEAAIRSTLQRSLTHGIPVRDIARDLRNTIGLDDRSARALLAYREGLLEREVPLGRAKTLADQYRQRLLNDRAERIARTELIRATNAGQEAAWRDAADQGLLDARTTRREWLVTPDDRLCPRCEAVPGMNPNGVTLSQPFGTPLGPTLYPPLHVNCRCTVVLTNLFPEEG